MAHVALAGQAHLLDGVVRRQHRICAGIAGAKAGFHFVVSCAGLRQCRAHAFSRIALRYIAAQFQVQVNWQGLPDLGDRIVLPGTGQVAEHPQVTKESIKSPKKMLALPRLEICAYLEDHRVSSFSAI